MIFKKNLKNKIATYLIARKIIYKAFPSYGKYLFLSLIIIITLAFVSSITPWLLGAIVDAMNINKPLLLPIFLFITVDLLRYCLQIISNLTGIYYTQKSDMAMVQAFGSNVMQMVFKKQKLLDAGTLLADAQRFKGSFTVINNILFLTILPVFLEIFISFIIVSRMVSVEFAIFLAITLLMLFLLACLLSERAKPYFSNQFSAQNRLQSFLATRFSLLHESALTGARYDDQESLRLEIKRTGKEIIMANSHQMYLNAIMMLAIWLVLAISVLWLAFIPHANAGMFVAIITAILRITQPYIAASQSLAQLGGQFLALEQGLRYFEYPHDVRGRDINFKESEPLYNFRNVQIARLKIPDFQIHRGNITLIQSSSGLGKSTLLNALCSLEKEFKGDIFFKGVNIHLLGSEDILDEFAVVSQNPAFIPASLSENLLWGNNEKDISAEFVKNIIDELDLENIFIRDSMNTSSISGGEKQRVAVARAILKGRASIILDEPTSAQDLVHSQMLIDCLKKYFSTIIIFSHDPLLLEIADVVYELQADC